MTRTLVGLVCDHCRAFGSFALSGAYNNWIIESKNISKINSPESEQIVGRHFCGKKCQEKFSKKGRTMR